MNLSKKTILSLLKASSFLVFIGRAYQHLFWDAPFRTLLWDQKLLEVLLTFFKIDWNSYVTNLALDGTIQSIIKIQGLVYLFAALTSLLITFSSKNWMKIILYIGGFSLLFLSFLYYKDKGYQIAMLLEHGIQVGVVFLLLFFLKKRNTTRLLYYLKYCIAITFASHGVYALGLIYPLPGNFVTMTLNLIPIKESFVIASLFIMGVIDLVIAFLIFIPKASKWVLFYAFLWGMLTAFARVANGLHYDISFGIIHQYFFETIYRIPHGLVPLLAFGMIQNKIKI